MEINLHKLMNMAHSINWQNLCISVPLKVVFSNSKKKSWLFMGDTEIKCMSSVNYLRVKLVPKLDWGPHCNKKISKGKTKLLVFELAVKSNLGECKRKCIRTTSFDSNWLDTYALHYTTGLLLQKLKAIKIVGELSTWITEYSPTGPREKKMRNCF